jgi:hypothetical protein
LDETVLTSSRILARKANGVRSERSGPPGLRVTVRIIFFLQPVSSGAIPKYPSERKFCKPSYACAETRKEQSSALDVVVWLIRQVSGLM